MADTDLTLQVLVEMRDEIRNVRDEGRQTNRHLGELRGEVGGLRGEVGGLRGEVGELREQVHGITERLDTTNQRLGVIEHTMVDYGTQLVILGRYMKNSTSRQEDAIADLRTRVAKLEAKD